MVLITSTIPRKALEKMTGREARPCLRPSHGPQQRTAGRPPGENQQHYGKRRRRDPRQNRRFGCSRLVLGISFNWVARSDGPPTLACAAARVSERSGCVCKAQRCHEIHQVEHRPTGVGLGDESHTTEKSHQPDVWALSRSLLSKHARERVHLPRQSEIEFGRKRIPVRGTCGAA